MAPRSPHRSRDRERGNSLLLALIVMSALATLGSLTVVSVQSSLKTSTNDRSQSIALYAAESGAAAAMDMLRNRFDDATGWTQLVTPSNTGVVPLGVPDLPSSGAQPGTPDNLFSTDLNAWYSVELYNNRDDPGFALAAPDTDRDGKIIIRSTGHGPQGSLAVLEWEVQRVGDPPRVPPLSPPWPVPPLPSPPPPWTPPHPPGLVLLSWHIVL